jgi:hypothetical protein
VVIIFIVVVKILREGMLLVLHMILKILLHGLDFNMDLNRVLDQLVVEFMFKLI